MDGGPTFEDLSIDDKLSQLERVVKYATSSIALQRLVHTKMLGDTAAVVGLETVVQRIVPLFDDLSSDDEYVVRQHLAEQLFEIACVCAGDGKDAGGGGYRLLIETILPTLSRLLADRQAEVRQSAGDALVGVARLMKDRPMDLGQYVLTIVLQLAHDDENEELRMTAAGLLNDLAEILGPDLCKQFVTPDMVSLGEDPVFRVRKATALNLYNIARVVGESDRVDRLLPTFIRLTKDDMYRVRKACTESMVDMAKAVGPEVTSEQLTEVFLRLSRDSSKLVRDGALQHLGPFISTLHGDAVGDELISLFSYTAMGSSPGEGAAAGESSSDPDLRLFSAFSFPAVVLTLGKSRWDLLKGAYKTLTRDEEWNVRKTLAYSMHEIAKVLDEDQVEADLVPEMECFLRDVEEVRMGIIKNLAVLFERMGPECRKCHLDILSNVLESTSPFNWRLRERLAAQISQLVTLFSPDDIYSSLVPLSFHLLGDPVCCVREATFAAISPLMAAVTGEGSQNCERRASVVSRVREFAHAKSFHLRQMYIYICQRLPGSMPQADFIADFLPSLVGLASDSVVNVRIALAKGIGTGRCPAWLMELPEMQVAIRQLSADPNADVRHFLSLLPEDFRQLPLPVMEFRDFGEAASCVSDESTRTQLSSNARSEIAISDFVSVASSLANLDLSGRSSGEQVRQVESFCNPENVQQEGGSNNLQFRANAPEIPSTSPLVDAGTSSSLQDTSLPELPPPAQAL